MNGAEAMLRAAMACGIDTCFANPGTTELHVVEGLDRVPGIRPVLSLFEGVCTGAADGYGRMTGRPALTLVHLGPGFANGIANLHNARRAHSPVVNLIGDHATWHLAADAPLTTDVDSLAKPVSAWVRHSTSAPQLPADMLDAIVAARTGVGQVATLVVHQDHCWEDAGDATAGAPVWPSPATVMDTDVIDVANAVRAAGRVVLLIGGNALGADGKRSAARLRDALGITVYSAAPHGRQARGRNLPTIAGLPYFPEPARRAIGDADLVVLAGAKDPVTFFGYPEHPSRVVPSGVPVVTLAGPAADAAAALDALADELKARANPHEHREPAAVVTTGDLSLAAMGETLAALLPPDAVIVNESITSGGAFESFAERADPHDVLNASSGGAIGGGLPQAVGAAIACPGRQIVDLQADGSAGYTVQALWTMAREQLDVVVVLFSNQ
ncbi:MAG: acetolactate synthase large subunit, partial [Acidimicrobiaceae bacterium]|nr:acetolactate synthase large subunit [Acidimicrobiaceae bacterium]